MIFLFLCIQIGNADESWVIFEKGKENFRNKEYGLALASFKEAISVRKNYPEAEIAIGDVYATSSEYRLAESQYRKAIKQKSFFEYPEKIYIALYRLVDLYKRENNNKLLEETLLAILGEDKDYYGNAYLKYKDVFPKLFLSQGPDRVLVLYRMPVKPFFLKSLTELALYYYKHGRFEQSMMHSLLSLVTISSVTLGELRNEDPLYQLTSLESLLDSAFAYDGIREYLTDRADVFTILYYLANTSYTLGKYSYAKKLWGIVARNKYSTVFREKARNQLSTPVIEEYVDLSPNTIDFVWNY
jgi:tetratricopeptide (TPR) repeat protein